MSNPAGYANTMDRLAHPDDWDVPGIIADTRRYLIGEDDGETLAVIDTLIRECLSCADGNAPSFCLESIRCDSSST